MKIINEVYVIKGSQNKEKGNNEEKYVIRRVLN